MKARGCPGQSGPYSKNKILVAPVQPNKADKSMVSHKTGKAGSKSITTFLDSETEYLLPKKRRRRIKRSKEACY